MCHMRRRIHVSYDEEDTCIYMRTWVCACGVYAYICICMHTHHNLFTHTHTHTTHTHIHMYMYAYTHTHTHIPHLNAHTLGQDEGQARLSVVYICTKETYYSVKRDLLQCQKRPTTVLKETYYSVKRDLLQR